MPLVIYPDAPGFDYATDDIHSWSVEDPDGSWWHDFAPDGPLHWYNKRYVILWGAKTQTPSSGASLLMHGDGSDGSTVFTDEAGNTVTPQGNAHISTAQSKFGGASMCFDGDSDYLSLDASLLSGYAGNITIELCFKLSAIPSGNAYNTAFYVLSYGPNNANPGCDFYIGSSQIRFSHYNYLAAVLSGEWTPDTSEWHHLAVVRYADEWLMYLDGVLISRATDSTAFMAHEGTIQIGACEAQSGGVNTGWFNGYIDELRITKGFAWYTGGCTPPTEAFEQAASSGFWQNLINCTQT